MIVSRAAFLKMSGAALAGTALPGWAFLRGTLGVNHEAPRADLSAADFRRHVGSTFRIAGVSEPVRLTHVLETPLHRDIEQFSLMFAASAGEPIPHGTYTFEHAAVGRLDIFITPVGAPGPAPAYQACFSRHLQSKDSSWPILS